ncbi:MAG TPA: DUF4190 domain-containing protein [Bacillales bacterium]|nr:DUF4190 domain-containing protein [Bacillales bacterium]
MTDQQPYPSRPPQTNGKAIASLVLGILSVLIPYLGVILGIIAIVFGNQAKRITDQNGEAGRGLAVAGFVCGIVGLCFWGLMVLLVIIGIVSFTHSTTVIHTYNTNGL